MSAMDRLKNTLEKMTGKAKKGVGERTDNRDLAAEGRKDEASGNVKNVGEDVKDVGGDIKRTFDR